MLEVKSVASWVVIGDLVGSRRSSDRLATHQRLADVLAEVAAWAGRGTGTGTDVRLQITVGDEFQGTFPTLGTALAATLRIRVGLLPDADVRCGIGLGPVMVLQESPRLEDGPGWWAARSAIETIAGQADRAALHGLRTRYAVAPGADTPRALPDPAAVNAALMVRDHLLTSLSSRSLSVLRGLLGDRTQKDIARDLSISPSAVSQRVRSDGLAVLVAADDLLGSLG